MKREDLEERLKQLESNFDVALAKVNAVNGAIEEVKYWLNLLDQKNKNDIESEQESGVNNER